jgi:hypothetical protein
VNILFISSSKELEPIFFNDGVDVWLVGVVIAFVVCGVVVVVAIALEDYFRKKFDRDDDFDDDVKKRRTCGCPCYSTFCFAALDLPK